MRGGGGGSRHSAPDIVQYRKQRGSNERFRGKQTERRVNHAVSEKQQSEGVVREMCVWFGVFIVGCVAFLAFVFLVYPRIGLAPD